MLDKLIKGYEVKAVSSHYKKQKEQLEQIAEYFKERKCVLSEADLKAIDAMKYSDAKTAKRNAIYSKLLFEKFGLMKLSWQEAIGPMAHIHQVVCRMIDYDTEFVEWLSQVEAIRGGISSRANNFSILEYMELDNGTLRLKGGWKDLLYFNNALKFKQGSEANQLEAIEKLAAIYTALTKENERINWRDLQFVVEDDGKVNAAAVHNLFISKPFDERDVYAT